VVLHDPWTHGLILKITCPDVQARNMDSAGKIPPRVYKKLDEYMSLEEIIARIKFKRTIRRLIKIIQDNPDPIK
jgi:hypothetical protein